MENLVSAHHGEFFLATIEPANRPVSEYLGMVSGEGVVMLHSLRKLLSLGDSNHYKNGLASAQQNALDDMITAAKKLGANGIVGIESDFAVLGLSEIVVVRVRGTAVKI